MGCVKHSRHFLATSSATKYKVQQGPWFVEYIKCHINGRNVLYGASFQQELILLGSVQCDKHGSVVFDGAASFNKDLLSWPTGKVSTMAKMFESAKSFNQHLS
jgi:hypothetical protein